MTSYKNAGVDKEAGYKQVELISEMVKNTHNKSVLNQIGGFSALFEPNIENINNPVLVSGTDGVGTKVVLAQEMKKYDTIGIDCVAMCVNDILCQGAKPLFFLDYIACGKLDPLITSQIVKGVTEGCLQADMALIGGETAEMPGVYEEHGFDMAGFALGMVDKSKIIDGKNITQDSVLIGLPSSGVHSNGFSLVRHVFKDTNTNEIILNNNQTLSEALLEPTKIYVKPILELMKTITIQGMAHITGGGLYENLPRTLPNEMGAKININTIPKLEVFEIIQETGKIKQEEMFGTFNMGVGFVIVIDKKDLKESLEILIKENAFYLGDVCQETGIHLSNE